MTLIWERSLLTCFEGYLGVPYSHRQSRKKMMSTFIIVNITLYVRDNLENKSMLAPSKEAFLPLSVWSRKEYTWALI